MMEEYDDMMEGLERSMNEPFYMVRHNGLFMPAPLSKGDKIGIVSLSGYDTEEVMGAMSVIASHGYVPVVSEIIQNSIAETGILPRGERIVQLHTMLEDSKIKAIFCCGDGSGSIEILPNFSYGPIAKNPKLIVGHGDVTALLSMWVSSDIASIHGPMCSELIDGGSGVRALFNLLSGDGKFDYMLPVSSADRKGKASGILLGGNLSVLTILGATSYDLIDRYIGHSSDDTGAILFFEASGISLRQVRDMLLRYYLTGALLLAKGLIFGSFKDCKPYGSLNSIQDVVEELEYRWMINPGIPIVFDFPIGEGTPNIPLIEGAMVEFEVNNELVNLRSLSV